MVSVLILLLSGLNSGSPASPPFYEEFVHGDSSDERMVTICDMLAWREDMIGVRVRLKANYRSDFYHGSSLGDENCSGRRLPIQDYTIQPGLPGSDFLEYTWTRLRIYRGREISVDVSGIFSWVPEDTINPDLSQEKQETIGAHGSLVIDKVWDFERFEAEDVREDRSL